MKERRDDDEMVPAGQSEETVPCVKQEWSQCELGVETGRQTVGGPSGTE